MDNQWRFEDVIAHRSTASAELGNQLIMIVIIQTSRLQAYD